MSNSNKISLGSMKNNFNFNVKEYSVKSAKINYNAPNNSEKSLQIVPDDFIGPLAPWQTREREEVQRPQISIPNNDWIFGQKSLETGQFGGNQGSLTNNVEKWIDDPKVHEIVSKYYSNFTKEDLEYVSGKLASHAIGTIGRITESEYNEHKDEYESSDYIGKTGIELLFEKMNSIGCGYISHINVLMLEYIFKGEYEFQQKFGFRPYELVYDENGKLYKDFNYEYVFLDYFLYFAKREGFETIEDVYGNIQQELELYGSNDAALDEKKQQFERTGMTGAGFVNSVGLIIAQPWEIYLEEYAKDKGFNLKTVSGSNALKIDKNNDYEAWEKGMLETYNWLVKNGYKSSYEIFMKEESNNWIPKYEINDINAYKQILNSGKSVEVDCLNFDLYSTEDLDGNGLFDDVLYENIGGHAMIVVGTTSDGKLIVSSWGRMFVLDPNFIKNIVVYDFGR